jgi:hypothetical protein
MREVARMAVRREVVIKSDTCPDYGYEVTVTRKGIEVFGYTGIVGCAYPLTIPWERLLKAREEVMRKGGVKGGEG